VYLFVVANSFVPVQQAVLRSVQSTDRTLAFGLYLLSDGFGTALGAISLGAAFDKLCVLWKQSSVGGSRSCVRYDSAHIGWMVIVFGAGMKCVGVALFAGALHTYKRRSIDKRTKRQDIPNMIEMQ